MSTGVCWLLHTSFHIELKMICLIARCAFIIIQETLLMASHVFWTEPFSSLQQHCLETCDPCQSNDTRNSADELSHFDASCNSCTSVCQRPLHHPKFHESCQTEGRETRGGQTRTSNAVGTATSCRNVRSSETNTENRRRSEGTQAITLGKSRKTNTGTKSKSIASVSSQSPRVGTENGTQIRKSNVSRTSSLFMSMDSTGTSMYPRDSKVGCSEGKSDGVMTPQYSSISNSQHEEESCPPKTGTTPSRRSSVLKQCSAFDEDNFLNRVASELGRETGKMSEQATPNFVTAQPSFPESINLRNHMLLPGEVGSASAIPSEENLKKHNQNWLSVFDLTENSKTGLLTGIYVLVLLFLVFHLVFIAYHHCVLQNIRDSYQEDQKEALPQCSQSVQLVAKAKTDYHAACRQNFCKHRIYDCSRCPKSHAHQEGSSSYIIA